ncbi:tripartite tricarboxylate transporter substrate binding protein BugE [Cupriavidus sp. BIC8F]|uniref:tripartite tricarboxylate transporter substrate binding protein BugE n=1 Tax=Cupriavidus sp. BIC8F TaxID=3079014 RepID=UPI0029166DC9|nr:tripartite tricarboxylate transporter substrate binding protein BugE [Cupriavidus sp. BIC8F]
MVRARISRRQLLLSGTAAAATLAFAGSAFAQASYPTRPIRLIVPFAAGGSTDLSARLVAEFAGRELGQSIVVENKGGAGGSLGMEQVANAAPDGYTIGMATVSTHGSNPAVYPKLKYDPIKDFSPVTNVVAIPSVFAVHPSVPAKTMQEFIALARANPGKYSFASPGAGSLGHVNIENFMMLAKIDLLHVPYKGAGLALNDAVAGQVNAITDNLSSTLPHVKAGRLRALAVLGAGRSAQLPNVPTYAELGFKDMGDGGWFGIVAPANTPPAIVARLNQAIHKAMLNPEFKRKVEESGGTLVPTTPEQFKAQIQQAMARYVRVAKAADIKLD